jgi:site-specific DNA-cytosine methylase
VSSALTTRPAQRMDASDTYIIADTLKHGGHPNTNTPGRRREDDTNLVPTGFHMIQDPISEEDGTPALGRKTSGMGVHQHGVRRLTPRECERLQGFPDDWTLIDGATDSKRYAALGNAVTVNVVEWIARRLIGGRSVHP